MLWCDESLNQSKRNSIWMVSTVFKTNCNFIEFYLPRRPFHLPSCLQIISRMRKWYSSMTLHSYKLSTATAFLFTFILVSGKSERNLLVFAISCALMLPLLCIWFSYSTMPSIWACVIFISVIVSVWRLAVATCLFSTLIGMFPKLAIISSISYLFSMWAMPSVAEHCRDW